MILILQQHKLPQAALDSRPIILARSLQIVDSFWANESRLILIVSYNLVTRRGLPNEHF